MTNINYLRTLTSMIHDEGKCVSLSWFTREMGITSNESKQLFEEYIQSQPKGTLKLLYYISGYPKLSSLSLSSPLSPPTTTIDLPHIIAIIPEDQLEFTKTNFQYISSCHIYSITLLPNTENDTSLLSLSNTNTNGIYTVIANDLSLQTKRLLCDTTGTINSLGEKYLHNSYSIIINQPPIRIEAIGTKRNSVIPPPPSSSTSTSATMNKSSSIGSTSSTSSTNVAAVSSSSPALANKKNSAISNFFATGGTKSASIGNTTTGTSSTTTTTLSSNAGSSSATKTKVKRQTIDDSDDDNDDANFNHAALDAQREREAEETIQQTKSMNIHSNNDKEIFNAEEEDEEEEESESNAEDTTGKTDTGKGKTTSKKPRKSRDPNAPKVRKNAKYASYAENDTIIEGGGTLQTKGTRTLDTLKNTQTRVLKSRTYVNDAGYIVTEDYWEENEDASSKNIDMDVPKPVANKVEKPVSTHYSTSSTTTSLTSTSNTTTTVPSNKSKQMVIDDDDTITPPIGNNSTTTATTLSTTSLSSSSSVPFQSVPPPSVKSNVLSSVPPPSVKSNVLSSVPPPSAQTTPATTAGSKTQMGLKAFFGAKK